MKINNKLNNLLVVNNLKELLQRKLVILQLIMVIKISYLMFLMLIKLILTVF